MSGSEREKEIFAHNILKLKEGYGEKAKRQRKREHEPFSRLKKEPHDYFSNISSLILKQLV